MKLHNLSVACAFALAVPLTAFGGDKDDDVDIGKLFTGDNRVEQADIAGMSRDERRLAGMRMFTNPFLTTEGFGDGDDIAPTGAQTQRGTLQANGTFQRIGGLDAQTCLECHSIISRRTVPMRFGIGGVGGINNTVLGAGGNTFVDLNLLGRSGGDKSKNIDGRVINPPFIFGAGGIELLANEMTVSLRDQIAAAGDGVTPLTAKSISFGSISKTGGVIDVNGDGNAVGAEGTFVLDPTSENFMVVAPFGRKGDAKSTRDFDIGALSFHFGMAVDNGVDHDLDGVTNEVLQGELSVLSVFVGTTQTPFQKKVKGDAKRGRQLIADIGCTECHVPKMDTDTKFLGFRSPEVANDPSQFIHTTVDLTDKPMKFEENDNGGVTVELFADLKRHFMGTNLAEFDDDAMFTTMRLWGVADTAPYLHDGRALTIQDAIETHGLAGSGSEAEDAVATFNGMSNDDKNAVLAFLDTLRTPDGTFDALLDLARDLSDDDDDQ